MDRLRHLVLFDCNQYTIVLLVRGPLTAQRNVTSRYRYSDLQ